jgi:3-methylcrotonyl-CoA carboxylase alpha subunit
VIRSLLIANRGEIACRIIKTAQRLGIRTVAVYSDADADALHVREADEAVHIGPAPAAQSYLDGAKMIAAALEVEAEAIHPGYGFLSENAAFAQAVIDARLVWVGAPPKAITAMGEKDAAKALMMKAGVPTTPGYLGEDQNPERLAAEAGAIGYPVLIKAVAGGGGKGMRKVMRPADFANALASCRREAATAFGNDRVLLEKWISDPRHIEVQVFGDKFGNVVHLFERDCSMQRRHQKVIEEAPAPGMDAETRAAICTAATRAAAAVNYQGAGTIEFIADASEGLRSDRIWFMEMNTRLQVEHPVTEAITGEDLVEWQLRVASGEPLPKKQDELSISGHAIEARLYSEDPASGFLPSTGTITEFDFPDGARIDTGVEPGSTVSPFYDPMIAKVIAHRDSREAAIEALKAALAGAKVGPLVTNAGFLLRLLEHPDFAAGRLDTGLIERKLDALTKRPPPTPETLARAAARLLGKRSNSPWDARSGLRLGAEPIIKARLIDQHGGEYEVDLAHLPTATEPAQSRVTEYDRGERYVFRFPRIEAGEAGHHGGGQVRTPMAGRVTSVAVKPGDTVEKDQILIIVEAMKMELALRAPQDGTVADVLVGEGEQVAHDAVLLELTVEE